MKKNYKSGERSKQTFRDIYLVSRPGSNGKYNGLAEGECFEVTREEELIIRASRKTCTFK